MNYLIGRGDTPPCGKCDLCSPTSESLPWDPGVRLYGQPVAVDVRLAVLGAVRDHDGWFGRWTVERMLLGIPQTNTQGGAMKLPLPRWPRTTTGSCRAAGPTSSGSGGPSTCWSKEGSCASRSGSTGPAGTSTTCWASPPRGATRWPAGSSCPNSPRRPHEPIAAHQGCRPAAKTRRGRAEAGGRPPDVHRGGRLAEIWEAGYNVSPQDDSRLILGREADGRSPRHWHLAGQVVANNRLIESIEAGTWDGRDLDAELARLDREHGGHHVFCPADDRLAVHPDGRVELADDERDLTLPEEVRSSLDELADRLLERWRAAGPVPWTVRQVTERLDDLGWERARARGAWLQVRNWLRSWEAVARVGRDYWVPADAIPAEPARTRLAVIRVQGGEPLPRDEGRRDERATGDGGDKGESTIPAELTTVLSGASTRWTTALRTVNLLEGFLTVPAAVRTAYPPAPRGGGRWEVMRGQWFETGEQFWVWLDRERHMLFGPELAERLEWREAGERFEITWAAECLVFRHGRR